MSRSDWKCSPVHKYWLNQSKEHFPRKQQHYVFPSVGEWVTQRALECVKNARRHSFKTD